MNGTFGIREGVAYIGEVAYPDAEVESDDIDLKTGSYHTRGFRITLGNGWTFSVIWGSGTYSSNHQVFYNDEEFVAEAPQAEIAAWNHEHIWFDWDTMGFASADTMSSVKGWVSATEARQFLMMIAAMPVDAPPGLVEATEQHRIEMDQMFKEFKTSAEGENG